MRAALAMAMLLLFGCSDGEPPAPTSAPATVAPVPPEPSDPTPSTGAETPPVDAELFGRIARGDPSVASLVDPEKGLLMVEYYGDASGEDPRADDDGVVRIAERLCGEQARARAERLQRGLGLRAEQSSHDPTFTCDGLACSHPAEMEYDVSGTYRFGRRADGGLRLESVTRIEGGPVTDDFLERAREWTDGQRLRLEGGTCPPAEAP